MADVDVDVELTLQGGEVEEGGRRYEPGSSIQGWARLTPNGTIACRRVTAHLEWHTESQGRPERDRADEVELLRGPLSGSVTQRFTLTAPWQPWSYTGYYINIVWQVGVVADIPHWGDIGVEEIILIAPRRAGRLTMEPPRINVPPDVAPTHRRAKRRG
jgi:hypothetical protein